MSAILRHRHPNRFTILPNDAIRNPALSFRAVGVLAHLLSLPDGAKVDSATLAKAHKEGRDAVRGAFGELAAHGYYRRDVVRLADGTLRTEVVVSSTPMEEPPGRTGDGFPGAGRPEPENPEPENPASAEPASAAPAPDNQAPKEDCSEVPFIPPNPPAQRGGSSGFPRQFQRPRAGGLRAVGANPRAEADRIEALRRAEEVARRQADLDGETAARRAAEAAAAAATDRFEAEALAVSAALDDDRLAAVVARVEDGMAGPLARSPLAVAHAAVAWCRTAMAQQPGPFVAAVDAALATARHPSGEDRAAAALDLPAPPGGTATLRERIAGVVRTAPVT